MSNIERANLERKNLEEWTIAEVGMWLEFMNMGDYKIPFIEQQISGQDLVELNEADLMELGVKALGQRKKLQRKIKELQSKRENFGEALMNSSSHSDANSNSDFDDRASNSSESGQSAQSGQSGRSGAPDAKIKCKCYYRKDIRLISIKKNVSYRKLVTIVREEYNRTLQLYWEDEDGDSIKIGSDRQLKNAINSSGSVLKLKLQRRKKGKGKEDSNSAEKETKFEESETSLLDSLVDGCIIISSDGYIEFFNAAAEKIFGYSRNNVIGKNVNILMTGMYAARHDNYIQNYHKTGIAKIIGTSRTVLGKHKDGNTIQLELSISECKTNGRHTFTGIVKRSSGNDSDQNKFNLALLDSLLEPVLCIDSKGIILHSNPKAIDFFGYSRNQLVGNNIKMLMPNPHRQNHDYYLAEYMNTGKTTVIGKVRDTVCELENGTICPIRLSVSETILPSGEKRFIGTITERQEVHTRKVTKLVQQRQVIETLATPAIIINSSGIIQAFNQSALKIFGYSLEEVLGQNVNMIVGKEHSAKHDSYLQNYLRTGISKVMGKDRELYAKTKSGSELKILLTVTEHKSEDNSSFFTGMFFHTRS